MAVMTVTTHLYITLCIGKCSQTVTQSRTHKHTYTPEVFCEVNCFYTVMSVWMILCSYKLKILWLTCTCLLYQGHLQHSQVKLWEDFLWMGGGHIAAFTPTVFLEYCIEGWDVALLKPTWDCVMTLNLTCRYFSLSIVKKWLCVFLSRGGDMLLHLFCSINC